MIKASGIFGSERYQFPSSTCVAHTSRYFFLKTILLTQSHPPPHEERKGCSNYLSSLTEMIYMTRPRIGIRINWKLHSSAKSHIDTNYTARSLPLATNLFFSNLLLRLLRRVQLECRPLFRDLSLCLPRGKYEWHNASRPRLCHPLSPPSPLGLDSTIELQKRMPAAAAGDSDGYNTLMFYDQLQSIECMRLCGELNYPRTFWRLSNLWLLK